MSCWDGHTPDDWVPPMTTTDPKLIERIARAIHDAADYALSDFGHMRDMRIAQAQAALSAMPTAAAINEAAQKERAGIAEHALRALEQIAGSHWERFGIDQTDVEQIPDLSADEAMNLARETLMDITERSVTPLPSPPAIEAKESQHG